MGESQSVWGRKGGRVKRRRVWRELLVRVKVLSPGFYRVLRVVLTQSKGELYLLRHSGNLSLWP